MKYVTWAALALTVAVLAAVTASDRGNVEAAGQFPFVNIAASARGTVVRISVNSPFPIVGEYSTAPDGMGKDPSRTTVDQNGAVWVANRAEFGSSGGTPKGSVTRIGLIVGGTRTNSLGVPTVGGQYIDPTLPNATTNNCWDRDSDGLIKTSTGLANILPWTNAGSVDTNGGVATAEDECIINYTRVTGTGTRTVAIDSINDVWVGGLGDLDHEKLDGDYPLGSAGTPTSATSGQPIAGTQFNVGCGGYGGLVWPYGGQDVLWSARSLVRAETSPLAPVCLGDAGIGNYGLGVDCNTGHIWYSSLGGTNEVYELDPADGSVLNSYPQGFGAQGVVVDRNSHVWVAEIFGDEVLHLAPITPGLPLLGHVVVGTVGGFAGTTGVAVDVNGYVWASEISGNSASRIDPSGGAIGGGGYPIGAKDPAISIGAGAGPYNYSDMTGLISACITELPQSGPPVVGGIAELLVDDSKSSSAAADGSGGSIPYLASGLAAVAALMVGAWFARRRWLR